MIDNVSRREWAQHPVTQEFISKINEYRQDNLELIGTGNLDNDKIQRVIGRAIAAKSFLDSITNLTKEPEEVFAEVKEVEDVQA